MAERGKCQVCNKLSDSRCSMCRLVFYCSKAHQKQDWETHKEACTKKKYSLESHETMGRHLVAREDIKADSILMKDRPIVLSLKINSLDLTPYKLCLGCYKEIKVDEDEESSSSSSESSSSESSGSGEGNSESKRKQVCSKCGLPICSPHCATQHFHKTLECRLISEAPPFNPELKSDDTGSTTAATPTNVRETILRNLIYFRCILLKFTSPSNWDEMMSLKSHDDEKSHQNMPQLERTTRIFTMLKRILKHINHPTINQVCKPELHKILGILDINALRFNISQEVELSAIFPSFSMLEHSCFPNVKFYLSPTTITTSPPTTSGSKGGGAAKYVVELFCRSAVKIKKGESLAISHSNLMWNTEKRREFLKKERGFWCTCVRCRDPFELGSNFSTIICTHEACKGYAVPFMMNPPAIEMQWKCSKCSKVTPPWQVKQLDARLCEMVSRTKPNLQNYKDLLSKMDDLVHPDYYLSFVINHSLVQLYGEKDNDNASEDENIRMHNTKMLEDKVALCNRLVQVIKKLDPGLAKLNIYTAVIYYEMQSAILAMCGGEVDDDFKILRHKPETVKLAKVYVQKCIDSFKYEFLDVPENKLKKLAAKKMEYLDFILTKFKPQ